MQLSDRTEIENVAIRLTNIWYNLRQWPSVILHMLRVFLYLPEYMVST